MKVELQNIKKYYQEQCIFENLNLILTSNLIHLTGGNGVGKSTLLKILSGSTCFEGSIRIDDEKQSRESLQKNIILANQEFILLENQTILNNIKIAGVNPNNEAISQLIDKELLLSKVNSLSGGQKKIVSLSIAFALEPSILLIDEFSNYLDEDHLNKIKDFIINYSENHMVIYVDHDINLGGEEFNLESQTKDLGNEKNSSTYKKRKFKFSLYTFLLEFKLLPLVAFLIHCLFFISLVFVLTILTTSPYEIAAGYYIENDYTYIPYKGKEEDDLFLYYGVELSIEEKIELSPFYYVTYYETFNFTLAKKIEVKEGYTSCYVFDMNADMLGNTFHYLKQDYQVTGIIEYPYSLDTTLSPLPTFFIQGQKPEDKETYTLMVNFENKKQMRKYFEEEKVYIENSGFLSSITLNLKKDLYKIILVVLAGITLFFQFLFNKISAKNEKGSFLFLRQYGRSELELTSSKLLGEIPKYLLMGIGGYFITNYLLNQYTKYVIFPWSAIINPSILWTMVLLILFFLLSICFYFLLKKKNSIEK